MFYSFRLKMGEEERRQKHMSDLKWGRGKKRKRKRAVTVI